MKIFEEGNWDNIEGCVICGEKTPGKVVLVGIHGTEKEGIMEAKQIHLDCIDLIYNKSEYGEYLIQFLKGGK